MTSRRRKPSPQRAPQEDCLVQWDDGTENLVFIHEIQNVDNEQPISIGSRIVMLYRKKKYYGKVIEIVSENQPTEQEFEVKELEVPVIKEPLPKPCKDEKKSKEKEETANKTQQTTKHQTALSKSSTDGSSSEHSSYVEDFSPADDTDNDPDYENPSCEAFGCSAEIFSSCHKCSALMCYDHFLICGELICHEGHKPLRNKKKGKEDNKSPSHSNDALVMLHKENYIQDLSKTKDLTVQFEDITVEEIKEFTRSVGVQAKPDLREISTQTHDRERVHVQQRELSTNMNSITDQTDMMNLSPTSPEKTEKRGKGKDYFCIFCKKLVVNFARHLQNSHRNEKEIVQLCALPKGSNERKKILDDIRGRGALYYNTNPELNKGNLIVRRRKPTGAIGYTPCPKCKNFYKKQSLHKHFKSCTGLRKAPKTLQATSLSFSLPTKGPLMDTWLKNEVLPGLSNKDDIKALIIEDPLLIDYGNYLCIRHRTNQHLTNMVRGKLRQMAKLLKSMREIDNDITTLESAFRPGKYDVFMKAVDNVAGYNPADATYRAPSLVNHIGISAQECANILQTKSIKNEDEELQNKVVNWLKLYKQEFYYGVGKSALSKVAENKWQKPRLVPLTTDIMELNKLINSKIETAEKTLEVTFDRKAYRDLNQGVMLQIITFNRKRIGEVERLQVSDFNKRHNIQKDSEIYKTLSANEKIVASRYMRMEVRGKLGRPVSLLISKKQVQLIKTILKLRGKANVWGKNPYVFGRNKKKFYSAPPAMRLFAKQCHASRPELLTGTKLRKHMATISQAMDLTDNDLSILADFMGHNITTHRNFYRMPSEVTHLARMSQVLMSLQEGDVSKYAGKRLDEINVDVEINESDDDAEEERYEESLEEPHISTRESSTTKEIPPISMDEPAITPGGPTVTTDEPSIMTEEWEAQASPIATAKTVTPTKSQTNKLKNSDRHVTPPSLAPKRKKKKQIGPALSKTEIYSTAKQVTPIKKQKIQKKTWKTPERHVARRVFAENIRTGRLPSINDCLFAKAEYEELTSRTVDQLKAWVYNEINRNKRMSAKLP